MPEQPQPLTVTQAQDNSIRVEILPATDTSQTQYLGVARVGDNRTVNLQTVVD